MPHAHTHHLESVLVSNTFARRLEGILEEMGKLEYKCFDNWDDLKDLSREKREAHYSQVQEFQKKREELYQEAVGIAFCSLPPSIDHPFQKVFHLHGELLIGPTQLAKKEDPNHEEEEFSSLSK